MVDTAELRAIIVRNGKTQKDVAVMLGISAKTFYGKMKKGAFGTNEAKIMIENLCILDPAKIFFADEVT